MLQLLLKVIYVIFLIYSCGSIKAQTLATNTFSLPALAGSGPHDFQRITFDIPFANGITPIVTVTTSDGSSEPMTLRIININNTGFDVIQTEPVRTGGSSNCGTPVSSATPCDGAHGAVDAAYLAVTVGSQTLSDGTIIVAGINSTISVQHNILGSSITKNWDNINIDSSYANPPVILAQIQTMNNETNLSIGSPYQITTVSVPFMESAVSNVTSNSFSTAIELVEVDDGNTIFETPIIALNEEIGWIAITNGANSSITFDGTNIGFATSIFNNVNGVQNGCVDNTITNIPESCSSPIVLSSMNTRNGGNGGWIKRCNLSTSDTGSGTNVTIGLHVDEDQDRDVERSHINEEIGTVVFCEPVILPVSIAYINITYKESEFKINWITSSETNSLAYEVWGKFNSQWKMIGEAINSKTNASLSSSNYSLTSQLDQTAEEIFIHHIDTNGKKEYFGPYYINESYGKKHKTTKINWQQIKAINKSLPSSNDSKSLNIQTTGVGIHRIYSDQIPAFVGQDINSIALTLSGNPIGRYIASTRKGLFNNQSYIDFYVEKPSKIISLYLKHNIYQLTINPDKVKKQKDTPLNIQNSQSSYPRLLSIEENNKYDFTSPLPDPWYQARVLRSNTDGEVIINVNNPKIIPGTNFELDLNIYGVTDFKSYDTDNDGQVNNDHHLEVYINQYLVHEEEFDGHVARKIQIKSIPSEQLSNQTNAIKIKLINDTGYPYDLIHIDSIVLKLKSEIIAKNNTLDLTLFKGLRSRENLQATGFVSTPDVSYAYQDNKLYKLETASDGVNITFPIVKDALNYWLSSSDKILTVTVKNQQEKLALILPRHSNYLVIAHPNFMPDQIDATLYSLFNDYLAYKNLSAHWINVDAIYDHFGFGIPEPKAIKDFIKHANTNNTIEYVLLVGGDSCDYHNNLNVGSISHIPSWYKQTNSYIYFTPTDIPYIDLNSNGYPDIAIGRWSVKSTEELNRVINNTIKFSHQEVNQLLSISENTDAVKQVDYQQQLNNLATKFPTNISNTVSLDQLMIEHDTDNPHDIIGIAQNQMLEYINSGADLIMFSGHGSPSAWTFYGLLSPNTVEKFTGNGEQFYLPLACYTTYYADPSNYSLAHQLIYGGAHGSVGIAGAVSLSSFSNNETIAALILENMNNGMSIGKATLAAKKRLNRNQYQDVILNWATLSEPSLTFK